jgi:hypothetical protein
VVVLVLGQRNGAGPPVLAAGFAAMLADGIAAACYAQWAFFFVRHRKKRSSLYRAGATCEPAPAPGPPISTAPATPS